MNRNPLLGMVEKRKVGMHSGIPSFCCANKIVIEAIMEQAERYDDAVLIEATSNQVNQFGGYMDMTSSDFKEYVYRIADKIGFDKAKIVLGGDHLGPLPWCSLPADEAMEHAKVLVGDCVRAGYTKIHLDTSMRLGDDPTDEPLSTAVIARRSAVLYTECEKAYKELHEKDPGAIHPVFIIGSEVPVPGGIADDDDKCKVTTPEDFENTLLTYKQEFAKLGMSDAWKYIIGVVIQPGVEFGVSGLKIYNRIEAYKLCETLKKYPDIVFEGHSTDYQPPRKLREMVEDGIAIIKVGPALTYALREALFAMSYMEKELIHDESKRANFIETLDTVMKENPKSWEKYYEGSPADQERMRKYSFSDRSRYYFTDKRVKSAMAMLFQNLNETGIPLMMLHQYMPLQFVKVRDGMLSCTPRELAKDAVVCVVESYNYAVKLNYTVKNF